MGMSVGGGGVLYEIVKRLMLDCFVCMKKKYLYVTGIW